MENHVHEPDCILKVSVCTCDECSSKLRKFFLKIHGVKAVGLIREKNFVLITGEADPIGLLHALQLKGEEGEIIYYRKPDPSDDDTQTPPDYDTNTFREGKKNPFPKHFNSSSSAPKKNQNNYASTPDPRRSECKLWSCEDEDGARESYPGHVRESYVAGPAYSSPKECTQTDCPFHDHYLKSADRAVGPVPPPPPPVPMGFYGGGGGYSIRPQYGFLQRPLPPPPSGYGYGYGHRMMM